MFAFFQKYRDIFLYLLIAGLTLILISFIFRTPLVTWYANRKIEQFNRLYNADLKVKTITIQGFAAVRLTGITLKPVQEDTLARIDTVVVSVGIIKLLAGRLAIHHVELINADFYLENTGVSNNYMFLFRKNRKTRDTLSIHGSYAHTMDQLLRFAFDKIPLSLDIRNLRVNHSVKLHEVGFEIDRLRLENHYFRSAIRVHEDSVVQKWVIAGHIDNGARLAEFRLFGENGKISLPYLNNRWNARVGLDTLAFRFSDMGSGDDAVRLGGFAVVRGLLINQDKIARQPVLSDRLAVDYRIVIGADYAELDSSSTVFFNKSDLHPYLRIQPRPLPRITFSVHKPPFPAQDLFSSFPEGLFTNLDGLKVQGKLSWNLDFYLDMAQPDSLKFETELKRHQFSVLSYGNADFARINEPFTYTAYENDEPVRSFVVGPENPAFRRLDQMSPYLQFAVMTSEDGAFYQHRGFLPDAFRESMIQNIKERRFARGGSTISMQLVKNVFLNRNKTIARKIEEALIVWLIENQGICTKERMMEVYLNVIEWGPLIYGAGEAAEFYFGKDIARINLAEAIFLASIVPRPKSFKWNFDANGHLKESCRDFFTLVSGKMANKGWINAEEAENLQPDVTLKGPARLLLKNGDSLQVYSPK